MSTVPDGIATLAGVSPELAHILQRSMLHTPPAFAVSEIVTSTVMVAMRDGVRLATDVYLPPLTAAPAVAIRTPYARGADALASICLTLARRGYVAIAQDCRGTGDSEPDTWDYYMYEPEDGYDFVEWASHEPWFDGFLAACGGSYVGQTQWHMSMHPQMTTIVPDVSGLGVAVNTVHLHMFSNAYAKSVGKGADKVRIPFTELEALMVDETWATGYFNEPLHAPPSDAVLAELPELVLLEPVAAKRRLWEYYCAKSCSARAAFVRRVRGTSSITVVDVEWLSSLFGFRISHDAHTLPHPRPAELCAALHAPALLRTGWYDWGLNDALATWQLLQAAGSPAVRAQSRLFIAPSAHNMPGYHEGIAEHPELLHAYSAGTNLEMLLRWYETVRQQTFDAWPKVIYYLMGANEWRVAADWPVPGAHPFSLHLDVAGALTIDAPSPSGPDPYTYDPEDPTPTVGGSIVSYLYPPGSVDVADVQRRRDVLVYTTDVLRHDLDVVGPLRLILYASSSAVDTDFSARLSDVFPDGRAIQLQHCTLRTRYRDIDGDPEFLEPGRIYRLEIDLWATANRFKAGHRVRLDISSADFPRYDRNTNRGGDSGPPLRALQNIYHDPEHPSHLALWTLAPGAAAFDAVNVSGVASP